MDSLEADPNPRISCASDLLRKRYQEKPIKSGKSLTGKRLKLNRCSLGQRILKGGFSLMQKFCSVNYALVYPSTQMHLQGRCSLVKLSRHQITVADWSPHELITYWAISIRLYSWQVLASVRSPCYWAHAVSNLTLWLLNLCLVGYPL